MKGLWRVRAYIMMTIHSLNDLKEVKDFGFYTGFGDEWLRIGPIKTFMDGSFTMRKAAIYEPPVDNSLGILTWKKEDLVEAVKELHQMGWQICAHAQGDRGFFPANQLRQWRGRRDSVKPVHHESSLGERKKIEKQPGMVERALKGAAH